MPFAKASGMSVSQPVSKNPQNECYDKQSHINMLCATENNCYISRIIVTKAFHLINATWAIRYTYHMVLKASPETANIGSDILFDITSIADWNK